MTRLRAAARGAARLHEVLLANASGRSTSSPSASPSCSSRPGAGGSCAHGARTRPTRPSCKYLQKLPRPRPQQVARRLKALDGRRRAPSTARLRAAKVARWHRPIARQAATRCAARLSRPASTIKLVDDERHVDARRGRRWRAARWRRRRCGPQKERAGRDHAILMSAAGANPKRKKNPMMALASTAPERQRAPREQHVLEVEQPEQHERRHDHETPAPASRDRRGRRAASTGTAARPRAPRRSR